MNRAKGPQWHKKQKEQGFEIGETIPLSFSMQGYYRPFKIRGMVVRSNLNGVGVEFIEKRDPTLFRC